MIELRWAIEKWSEFPEGVEIHKTASPKLQYRVPDVRERFDVISWSDWKDVPTEYIEG